VFANDRQTDRQTHRQTHRHTDTQTHRHTDRHSLRLVTAGPGYFAIVLFFRTIDTDAVVYVW